jgi:hypothetical protein
MSDNTIVLVDMYSFRLLLASSSVMFFDHISLGVLVPSAKYCPSRFLAFWGDATAKMPPVARDFLVLPPFFLLLPALLFFVKNSYFSNSMAMLLKQCWQKSPDFRLDSGSSWLDGVNGILMQQEPNSPKQDYWNWRAIASLANTLFTVVEPVPTPLLSSMLLLQL